LVDDDEDEGKEKESNCRKEQNKFAKLGKSLSQLSLIVNHNEGKRKEGEEQDGSFLLSALLSLSMNPFLQDGKLPFSFEYELEKERRWKESGKRRGFSQTIFT